MLDNGQGIPLGVRKNLFAPFYTTKGEREPDWVLWVSRGIVEKHEGTIHFISSVRERPDWHCVLRVPTVRTGTWECWMRIPRLPWRRFYFLFTHIFLS